MNRSKKILTSFIWRLLERSGAQIISFVVSIILARILEPNLYGVIALVTVLISIMQVFVDSGLGSALVQKKDADDLDFSSVFYFNVLICSVLYVLMYFSAPFIALFYQLPELTKIVRVLGLTLLFSGIKNVQQSYVYRHMIFKRFFYATVIGTLSSGFVGIMMAIQGFGVWALVAQHLTSTVVDTLVLWITVKWRPKLIFSWRRLKGLLSYSWKILASSLADTLYNNIQQMVIGKLYSTEDLAHFSKGKHFPYLIINNVNVAIDSVLLPSMSQEQDDRKRIHSMLRRAMRTGTYIMAPLLIGLAAVAEPTVRILLTEKWIGAVPFLQIYCVTYLFYPIQTTTMNTLKAVGRSDIFLKFEIAKKLIGILALLIMMQYGVVAIAFSLLISSVTGFLMNCWINYRMFGYRYKEQAADIIPNLVLSMIMVLGICWVPEVGMKDFLTLVLQIALGAAIYIGASFLTKNESINYILKIIAGK